MRDLTLLSKCHQRYENGIPVKGVQVCGRAIIINNADFCELMNGMPVEPPKGFLIRVINSDVRDVNGNYQDILQPKFMCLVSDGQDRIELAGIALNVFGSYIGPMADFCNYSITLHLANRKVVKCVLHMLDKGIDIEYFDIQ